MKTQLIGTPFPYVCFASAEEIEHVQEMAGILLEEKSASTIGNTMQIGMLETVGNLWPMEALLRHAGATEMADVIRGAADALQTFYAQHMEAEPNVQ